MCFLELNDRSRMGKKSAKVAPGMPASTNLDTASTAVLTTISLVDFTSWPYVAMRRVEVLNLNGHGVRKKTYELRFERIEHTCSHDQ